MTRPDDALTHFDHWLDACIAGESTPGDAASPSDSDASLRTTARQLHDLAAPPAASDDPGTTRRLDAIWETITMQAPTPAPVFGPAVARSTSVNSREVLRPPLWQRPRLAAGVNLFLAAVLIVGLGFGAWRTLAVIESGGGNDGSPPTELAALVQPEATPEGTPRPFQNNSGTPIPVPEGVELPTAAECQVEPLTVEEVMVIVEGGRRGEPGYGGDENREGSGVEGMDAEYVGSPPQSVMDAIIPVYREWTACVMAGSWMQVFALMDPNWIEQTLTETTFPVFTTREEGRAILEEVERTGELPVYSFGASPREFFGRFTLISPDPSHSWMSYPFVYPGTLEFDDAGEVIRRRVVDAYPDNSAAPMTYLRWSPSAGRWVIWVDQKGQG